MTPTSVTVTISAAYGAGGDRVGQRLAEKLGVPFHDRAIPVTVSAELGVNLESVLAHDDRAAHGLGRLLAAAARMPNPALGGIEGYLSDPGQVDENLVAERTATIVRGIAAGTGGVILGRAAAVVLADCPTALHARLDGPVEARARQAAELADVDLPTAREHLRKTDAAREAYVKRLYGKDPRDLKLYQVVLDSTALSLDACVEILLIAAHERVAGRS